jgi:hypothetical protein
MTGFFLRIVLTLLMMVKAVSAQRPGKLSTLPDLNLPHGFLRIVESIGPAFGGFNFKWGHHITPDPESPKAVYISTFGGGVWHGSVTGDNLPVDIATSELQPVLS